jgi:hypothetical protein
MNFDIRCGSASGNESDAALCGPGSAPALTVPEIYFEKRLKKGQSQVFRKIL